MRLSKKNWLTVSGFLAVVGLNYSGSGLEPFMQHAANKHNGEMDLVIISLFLLALSSFAAIVFRIIKNKKIDGLSFVLALLVITCMYWINNFSGIECYNCSKG